MSTETPDTHTASPTPPEKPARSRRRGAGLAVAAIVLLAVGAVAGAGAHTFARPAIEMAPATPVAINAIPSTGIVTVKGQVAEIFGNKFVLQDGTGRALVETGRAGESGKLVAKDEAVTVQGRFDDGFLRASFLVHPDGRTEAIGPMGGPPHGPDGPHGWFKHGGPGRPTPPDAPPAGPDAPPAN